MPETLDPIILSQLDPPTVASPVPPRVMTGAPFRDGTRPPPPPAVLVLDSFEGGVNRITDPNAAQDHNKVLWSEYRDFRPDPETDVTEIAARSGDYGIRNIINSITGGSATSQFQFRPVYPPVEGSSQQDIRYMRECLEDTEQEWALNHYNRMSFWIKTPANQGLAARTDNNNNFHFGTYTRSTGTPRNTFESGNGHWYHYYNLPHLGVWHKLIVDWHPNHQRNASGSTEQGEKQYPTSQPGFNYFDLLTRFYLQVNPAVDSNNLPLTILYDDFLVYHDSNPEDVHSMYSLHGGYRQSDNTIHVGWNRLKGGSIIPFEVRYAFSSIHSIGWENATPAPDGIFDAPGIFGYNCINYETTDIDVGSNNSIFIAMRPVGNDLFREIEIELDIGD